MFHQTIATPSDTLEQTLRREIRRAAGNDRQLSALVAQVGQLVEAGRRDQPTLKVCDRLLGELRAAALGRRPPAVLEYKTSAHALALPTKRRPALTRQPQSEFEIEGLGATYDLDLVGDRIIPGAFEKSLAAWRAAERWPKMLFSHNTEKICGVWSDMRETDAGLYVRGCLAPTPLGTELSILKSMGGVDSLSIGYTLPNGSDFDARSGVRELKEIQLHELSIVALPAQPNAMLAAAHQAPESSTPAADETRGLDESLAKLRRAFERSSNVVPFRSAQADRSESIVEALDRLRTTLRA